MLETYILILLLLFFIQVRILTFKLSFNILSPVYINLIYFSIVMISSFYYYYFIPLNKKINLFNIDNITNTQFLTIMLYFFIMINSWLFGVNFVFLLTKKKVIYRFKKKNKELHIKIFFVVFLMFIEIYLLLATYNFEGFFFRSEYIPPFDSKMYATLPQVLGVILVIVLGFYYKKNNILSLSFFLFFIFLYIGTGSRRVILYYLIYYMIIFKYIKHKKFLNIFLLTILFIILIKLLYLRSLDSHGLLPYLYSYLDFDLSLVIEQFCFLYYYLFITSFFSTAQTYISGKANFYTFLISINPLPGNIAGWYEISDDLRINIFGPYTLYGEVFTLGILWIFIFFTFIGIIFALFELKIKKDYHSMFSLILIGMLTMNIFFSYQYNLREGLRPIYYSIILLIIFSFVKKFLIIFLKKDKSNE